MILAGDIGGTKTHLALFDWTTERVDPLRLETFHSADYASSKTCSRNFLRRPNRRAHDILESRPQDEPSSPRRTNCHRFARLALGWLDRSFKIIVEPPTCPGWLMVRRWPSGSNYPPYSCSTTSRRWRTALCSSMPMRWSP